MSAYTPLRGIGNWLQNQGHYSRSYEADIVRQFIGAREGDAILDLGCGEARWTVAHFPNGSRLFGLDPDHAALRAASGGGFNPVEGTAEHLPFSDGAFDKVISVCAIEHFQSDDVAAAELRRILRPGGVLGLTADSYSVTGISKDFLEWHRQRFNVTKYYSLEDLSSLFEQHGFLVTHARYLVCTRPYVRLALYQLLSNFSPLSLCLGLGLNSIMRKMDDLVGNREGGLKVALRAIRAA